MIAANPVGRPVRNLAGQKFGRLVVLSRARNDRSHAAWRCECDCGEQIITRGQSLVTGATKSCNCYNREVARASLAQARLFRHRKAG